MDSNCLTLTDKASSLYTIDCCSGNGGKGNFSFSKVPILIFAWALPLLNACNLVLKNWSKYSTKFWSATFSFTTKPITLSGKQASKVKIPDSAILAAIVIQIVPAFHNLL